MKGIIACLIFVLSFSCWADSEKAAVDKALCQGKFVNPVSDICWECIFPISIGAAVIAANGEDDIENPPLPICMCVFLPPTPGLSIGFWEPAKTLEVVRYPYCLVSLGGISVDVGISAVAHGRESRFRDEANGGPGWSAYQVHYYDTPWLYVLGVGFDTLCATSGSIDLAYMTELDPTWLDDEMTSILNPEAILFANPVMMLTCLADCAMANIRYGIKEMFWCAGCNGMMYPLNGHIQYQVSGTQGSSLLMQRFMLKMHRQMLAKRYHGTDALCGPVTDPIMDKRAYKSHMTYPIPYTSGCQPFGRTTAIWGSGREYPYLGEDFGYLIFRKRNCCVY